MESQHSNGGGASFGTEPANNVKKGDFSIPSKNFSFMSSSSESDSEMDADKTSTKDVSSSSNPRQEQSGHVLLGSPNNGSATESPSAQMMGKNGNPDSYRIPSSAFANKSLGQTEWSVASNESLFSIHGNMSFTGDQFFLSGQSGELVVPEEPTTSGQLANYKSDQLPVVDGKSAKLEGLGVADTADATGQEVLKENAENGKEKSSFPDGPPNSSRISHQSDESRSSIQSFAFPILTGEGGRSGSLKMAEEQPPEGQGQAQVQGQQQQQPPRDQLQPQTSAAAPAAAQTSWFSCFSCCCPSRS